MMLTLDLKRWLEMNGALRKFSSSSLYLILHCNMHQMNSVIQGQTDVFCHGNILTFNWILLQHIKWWIPFTLVRIEMQTDELLWLLLCLSRAKIIPNTSVQPGKSIRAGAGEAACEMKEPKHPLWRLLRCIFPFFRLVLKRTLLSRHAALSGVGRGVTEPDIKQKLGQVRGARRGRQERACGIEACVGTNLTCPPPPHLQAYLLTHALSSIPTPPRSSPLFSLHCIHHPLPTLQTPCWDRE